jgi:hypothetical protein
MPTAKRVFVSYAHTDNESTDPSQRWLDRLRQHLEPLVQQNEIILCTDQDIELGDDWHEYIQTQLNAACAAVLLVSPAFLVSQYIRNNELPVLLKKAKDNGLRIIPVILRPCLFAETTFKYPDPKTGPDEFLLSSLQAAGSPQQALSEMTEGEQDRALLQVAQRLAKLANPLTGSSPPAAPIVATGTAPWNENPFPPSKLPLTGEHLIGRSQELATLTRAWNNSKTHIVQIVAPGGVGKTQLVKKWRESLLDKKDHSGALRVFDWSFYSQGTQQQASADEFFDKALRWFGETELEQYKDPWAKGERLAQLVSRQSTLLILDGLEPLQHPPGPLHGELSDPSLQALLRGLSADNPGLCVVTTREAVPDLAELSEPRRVTVDLNTLAPADGAELLKLYGVTGSDEQLQQASLDVEGHALALILLGTYLRDRFGGDVVQRNRVTWPPGMDEDSQPALSTVDLGKAAPQFAKHARKVMASYVNWFEHEPDHDDLSAEDPLIARAAVSILRLLGLFNRPADAGCLSALRAEPAIPGLTEPLFALDDREELWQQAVIRLRQAHLLTDDDSSNPQSAIPNPQSLDAHPHVREYFAEQLVKRNPAAAREAHGRLYKHLKSVPNDELPDNLNDMMPLYHAVAHGCKAGLYTESFEEVYRARIRRGQKYFSIRKLGAIGTELGVLASFFDHPWSQPSRALSDIYQSNNLNFTAFCLRAMGRLGEAAEPMVFALQMRVEFATSRGISEGWKYAAIDASNLSELSLTLGDVSSAVRRGEQSVELADRSGVAFQRMGKRTTLAAALHAAATKKGRQGEGERGRADNLLVSPSPPLPLSSSLAAFREAEALQQENQPQYPLLYSLTGYGYCDLLLESPESRDERPEQAIARIREVRKRAETTLRYLGEFTNVGLLDFALDHLTLGRTYLLESRESRVQSPETEAGFALDSRLSALDSAEQHLNESVSLLRQSGQQDYLPLGLLHRAALWRAFGEGETGRGGDKEIGRGGDRQQEYFERAERDLAEAESIAARGSMFIWQIEAALERTRLCLAMSQVGWEGEAPAEPDSGDALGSGSAGASPSGHWLEQAQQKLDEARKLISRTEQPYKPHVPDWQDWKPPAYVGVFKQGEIVGYHCRNDEIAALQAAIDREH